MKKLFVLILLLTTLLVNAQDTPPTDANFKTVPTYSFKYYTTDSTVWMYKGTTYGWTSLGNKTSDSLRFYRLLNNHDSLDKLQEKSYNSLNDKPDLSIYAPIDNPTFTTKITTPTMNVTTGAAVNYFWQCTNAATGAGAWANITTSQSYKGTVDGDDGLPTAGGGALIDGTGTAGWFYVCIDAGTYDYGNPNGNSITLALNDQIHYNGTIWQKIPAGSSQWVTTGSDIYYNSGDVGVGTTSPGVRFVNMGATEVSGPTLGSGTVGANAILSNAGLFGLYTGISSSGDAWMQVQRNDAATDVYNILLNPAGGKVAVGGGTTAVGVPFTVFGSSAFRTVTTGAEGITIAPLTGSIQSIYSDYWTGSERALVLGTFTNRANQVYMTTTGRVGIMTNTPATVLDVNGVITATSGTSTQWNAAYTHSLIAGGNSVHVSTDENTWWDAAYTHSLIAGGNSVHVSVAENSNWDAAYTHSTDNTQAHSDYLLNNANDATTGTLTATNFILSSDKRLKKNITPIKKAFNIKFVQFELKSEPDVLRYGVIAQDVEEYYPELVRTDASGMKSVAYVDLLIGKIHELEQRIEALEKSNESMQKSFNYFLNEK